MIILSGILPAFIPIFIFAGRPLLNVLTKHHATFPMTCALNEELEIEDKTFSGSGTLITTQINCKLTIKNSKLTGDVAIESKGNTEVTIENSTIEGKDVGLKLDNNTKVSLTKGSVLKSPQLAAIGSTNVELKLDASSIEAGSEGVELGVNGKVWLSRKSKATADGAAIKGESNLEVTVDDSSIDSKDVAIVGNSNTKLKLTRGAKVQGARTAIRGGHNMKLTLDNATVVSEGTAICSGYNTEVNAARSIIQGGVEAFRLQRKPSELELRDTSVKGIQNFEAPGCSGASDAAAAATANVQTELRQILKNFPKGATKVTISSPTPTAAPTPVAPPAPPPFDAGAAASALDAAARSASANCRSSTGKPFRIFVNPGFTPDGANRGAVPSNPALSSAPEAACVLGIFRRVRIPPFDPKTLPGGMGRNVELK
jgi:hypothetical protein